MPPETSTTASASSPDDAIGNPTPSSGEQEGYRGVRLRMPAMIGTARGGLALQGQSALGDLDGLEPRKAQEIVGPVPVGVRPEVGRSPLYHPDLGVG